jgi:restriction endonuclease S subunit
MNGLLGELCELIGGGTPSKTKDEYWQNGSIKWISSRHIDSNGKIIGKEWITRKGLENSSSKIAPKDSIIFITRVSVGKYAIADDEYAINQDLTALIPKDERLSGRYLYSIAPLISAKIDKNAVGIGVRGINRKQLADIRIPLPPISIQEEIVAEIENYHKEIENYKLKIIELEKAIKNRINKVWNGEEE